MEAKQVTPIEQNTAIAKYELTPQAVAEMVKKYNELSVIEGNVKSYKAVRKACSDLVSLRVKIEE